MIVIPNGTGKEVRLAIQDKLNLLNNRIDNIDIAHNRVIFQATGIFTVQSPVVYVTMCGGGGGVALGYQDVGDVGWSSWAVIDYPIFGLKIGEKITVTIGAAGKSGTPPTDGGDSSFGSYLVVPGGKSSLTTTNLPQWAKNCYPSVASACGRIAFNGIVYGEGAKYINSTTRTEATPGFAIIRW